MLNRIVILLPLVVLAMSGSVSAQSRETPYWASIKAEKMYMRVGPSRDYKIAWVYERPGMPLKVVRVADGWRLVRDAEGDQGWVAASLLTRERGAIVIGEGLAAMREAPADNAKLKWNAEAGVIGKLGKCQTGWCEVDVAGRSGWMKAARLWGAGEP